MELKPEMTGLAFAKAINENATALGTTKNVKFEEMTAEHLRDTLNEQLTEAGASKTITFETEKVVEVYNEEVGAVLEEAAQVSTLAEEPELPEVPEEPETTEDGNEEIPEDEVEE